MDSHRRDSEGMHSPQGKAVVLQLEALNDLCYYVRRLAKSLSTTGIVLYGVKAETITEMKYHLKASVDAVFRDVMLKPEVVIRTAQYGLKDFTEYAVKRYFERAKKESELPIEEKRKETSRKRDRRDRHRSRDRRIKSRSRKKSKNKRDRRRKENSGSSNNRTVLPPKPRPKAKDEEIKASTASIERGKIIGGKITKLSSFSSKEKKKEDPEKEKIKILKEKKCMVAKPKALETKLSNLKKQDIDIRKRSGKDSKPDTLSIENERLFNLEERKKEKLNKQILLKKEQTTKREKKVTEKKPTSKDKNGRAGDKKEKEMVLQTRNRPFHFLSCEKLRIEDLQDLMYQLMKTLNSSSHTREQSAVLRQRDIKVNIENKKNRRKRKGFEVEESQDGSLSTSDCSKTGFGFRTTNDDTLKERYIYQYANLLPSVGRLYSSISCGTVFRVGSNKAMTAWHVVEDIIDPHKTKHCDFNRLTNDGVYIQFGDADPHRYKLKGLDIYHSKELDISVLEFDDSELSRLPPPLSLLHHNVFDTNTLSDIAIIGYGNSNHEEKCVTHSAKILAKKEAQSQIDSVRNEWASGREELRARLTINGKDADVVDRGYNGYDSQHIVLFTTFVGPGASGSPLFTKADPSSLEVVGVFTCGFPELAYNLPKSMEYCKDYTFEAGTKMSSIYEAIRLVDQTLLKDLFKT